MFTVHILHMHVHDTCNITCNMTHACMQAFGFAEVEQLYGMEIVRDAANQLKTLYGGKGKMKLKLFISVKGIKLYHVQTMVRCSNGWSKQMCMAALGRVLSSGGRGAKNSPPPPPPQTN